jgi:predicted metal-dependent hydrolase
MQPGGGLDEEQQLIADPRFQEAVELFDTGAWYACHDRFEELWHETQGPMRPVLQGILQIAVAQLHLERGNHRGATMLMGEALGRLSGCGEEALTLSLEPLRQIARLRLQTLQAGLDPDTQPLPRLRHRDPETQVLPPVN